MESKQKRIKDMISDWLLELGYTRAIAVKVSDIEEFASRIIKAVE